MLLQWTRFAVFHRKLDLDHLGSESISGGSPAHTVSSCRTASSLRLPINLEAGCIKSLLLFGLPFVVGSGRSNHIDSIFETTVDEVFNLGVVSISQMLMWEQFLLCQCLMDQRRSNPHLHCLLCLSVHE